MQEQVSQCFKNGKIVQQGQITNVCTYELSCKIISQKVKSMFKKNFFTLQVTNV